MSVSEVHFTQSLQTTPASNLFMTTLHPPSIKIKGAVRPLAHRLPANPHKRPALVIAPPGAPLPEPPRSASLRERCPPVMNQDPLSSCTAHAFTSALRFLHMSEGVDEPLSRLFCYWTTRVLVEQTPPEKDSGCIVANVVTALEKYGACLESFWPYDVTKFSEKPPQEAFDDALKRTVVTAHPITTLRALKLSIAAGFPVPLAFTVAKSVEDGEDGRGSHTWETGSFPLPADDDPANYDAQTSGKSGGKSGQRGGAAGSRGGKGQANGGSTGGGVSTSIAVETGPDHGAGIHIVLAVGYDDATGKVKVQNSWGTEFGDAGFGDLAYSFFGPTQDADMNSHTAPCMAYDAWTLRAQSDQMVTTEPVTVIETTSGDVSVSLDERPSSGMGWSVIRQGAGLTLVGSDFTPPVGGGAGHAVGGSGVRRFHLHANDVGTYALVFALTHPWIKGEAPVEVRNFQIVVKAS